MSYLEDQSDLKIYNKNIFKKNKKNMTDIRAICIQNSVSIVNECEQYSLFREQMVDCPSPQ